ncbi:MAG: NAD(P)/FAD-dependent oxidoreductase, partial [Acidobacteria bacterium]|nr:NAD(P)/FAD-dependent oxidoreductase [Acidobacteriota bacterium]
MEKLVVVGNGMAGIGCLEQILRHAPKFQVKVFGDETHVNYNRILLSSVLAGERDLDDIVINGLDWYQKHGIDLRLGARIVDVDVEARTVIGDDGGVTRFDKLLLATGSSPFIPPIREVAKEGVLTFRNLDDTRAILDRARPGLKAVVIGGGLLGLEAARGLQVRGCKVTVVHLLDTLMNLQLDRTGGEYLKARIEQLGVEVLLNKSTSALLGNGHVEGLEFQDGETLEAELVVVAAGIRPNVELGRKAGLEIRRGIVVNDFMETSHPDVFAVGECVEHRGVVYGLVAPLLEQGKVLAATITGNKGPQYTGSKPAAKLKIMGVDMFSAGDLREGDGVDVIRYEDPALGVYKKLLLDGNKLAGVILVGDAADSNRYMEWLRGETDLTKKRRSLLFPEPASDTGLDVAQMPDSDTVCGCLGVTKGTIIAAIHEKGVSTLAQLKECTRASTGCGSCTPLCQSLLRAVAPGFEEEKKKVVCACLPFSQESLREIVRTQRLRSVQEILDIYGNGQGCEVCKPALS